MKECFGYFAIILTFVGFASLFINIVKGKAKPHPFTWMIWASVTLIVFFAQFFSNGGIGTWSVGISGLIAFLVAILAYVKTDDGTIVKTDIAIVLVAVFSLCVWFITKNTLYTVLILTFVDLLAYLPTYRKAFYKPFEEHLTIFVIMTFRNVFSAVAMEDYSITNLSFQVFTALANTILIVEVLYRRSKLKK
ncbi:MAG: hypothetical protein ACI9CD_000096 [Candidatus Deianiraeaceae bacterium]|jgi:hypothetical protein